MGMTEGEFEFISPRAFYNKVHGFNQLRQADFELTRLQTVELLNIHIDPKKQIKDPRRLWHFSWDKKKKATQADAERFKKRIEDGG